MRTEKNKHSLQIFAFCLTVSFLVAAVGSFFTEDALRSGWYESVKPSITPPNYVFPIVWTILFFLIAVSLFLAWTSAEDNQKSDVVLVFAANFALNILWSVLYFWMRNPLLALIELIPFISSIAVMILTTFKIDRRASYVLVPYLLWVLFAFALNALSLK